MAPASGSRRWIYLSLGLFSITEALDLSTFGGQAEAKKLMEGIVGKSDADARRMLFQANDDEEDYTCSATKPCSIGCCGPL